VAILVRALLGGLVLLFTGSLPGTTSFAQNSSDSADWNDYENYSTSDWGPEVNGVSIRVTAPREISFGDSLALYLEKRCSPDHIKAGVNNWSSSVNGSIVKLEMWPRKGKRSVYSARRVPDRPSLVSDKKVRKKSRITNLVIGSVAFDLGNPEPCYYVPAPADKSIEALGLPSSRRFFAESGLYDCCVTISIPDSHKRVWSGKVTSDTFQVVVGPEVCLRLPVLLLVPREHSLGPACWARYDLAGYDTVRTTIRPNYAIAYSQFDFLYGYSPWGGYRCTIYNAPCTVALDQLSPGKIDLRAFSRLPNGNLGVTAKITVYYTPAYRTGVETTLWEKTYMLEITQAQADSLVKCGCSEPPKEGK
jgi:hypothetical protein